MLLCKKLAVAMACRLRLRKSAGRAVRAVSCRPVRLSLHPRRVGNPSFLLEPVMSVPITIIIISTISIIIITITTYISTITLIIIITITISITTIITFTVIIILIIIAILKFFAHLCLDFRMKLCGPTSIERRLLPQFQMSSILFGDTMVPNIE